VVFVTPHDVEQARRLFGEVRAEETAAERSAAPLHVFADLVVFLDEQPGRKARLDELAGEEYASDATVFSGTASELADLLLEWQETGLTGFRLRPGALPHDLNAITRKLVPELQRRSAFRNQYEPETLRGRLGLPRPTNRYATT
jgi:alkanesulfonate monooxygenase SsuD/methylene tetrahydromethanopterin reductase-like flavin-dependent oxidoreductase (luciferase family)